MNVCLYDCPLIRLSAYTIVHLYDCPLIRLSAYTIVRLYDCPLIRLSPSMIVLLYECPLIRLSAYTIVRLYDCPLWWLSSYTIVRLYNCPLIRLSPSMIVLLYECPPHPKYIRVRVGQKSDWIWSNWLNPIMYRKAPRLQLIFKTGFFSLNFRPRGHFRRTGTNVTQPTSFSVADAALK